jgi:hypothetical protein
MRPNNRMHGAHNSYTICRSPDTVCAANRRPSRLVPSLSSHAFFRMCRKTAVLRDNSASGFGGSARSSASPALD